MQLDTESGWKYIELPFTLLTNYYTFAAFTQVEIFTFLRSSSIFKLYVLLVCISNSSSQFDNILTVYCFHLNSEKICNESFH